MLRQSILRLCKRKYDKKIIPSEQNIKGNKEGGGDK